MARKRFEMPAAGHRHRDRRYSASRQNVSKCSASRPESRWSASRSKENGRNASRKDSGTASDAAAPGNGRRGRRCPHSRCRCGRARTGRGKTEKKARRFYDYDLLVVIIFLTAFGLIMIYSSSAYNAQVSGQPSTYYMIRQEESPLWDSS